VTLFPQSPSNGRAPRALLRGQAISAGLLVLIFLLDTLTPLGVAVPVLYVLPTLLFVWTGGYREPLVVAAIATVLTAAGFLTSRSGDPTVGLLNRAIAVAVVWGAASCSVAYLRSVERWTGEMDAANRTLQDSVRHLQDIQYALDQSAIVAATDQRGIITYVNDKFCEISKYSREELLGQDHRIINSSYHPKEFIRNLWRTIARGQIWRGEIRNKAKDGTYYWVDTTIVPFLNERGKPWQYLSIRYDITQRKAAEEKLRDEAALTQLGRLSAVVAHEVRNPLAGLKGSLQVLARRLPADFPGRDIIPPMLARIDALNGTVQDILTYSRPTQPKPHRFDLLSVVQEAVASARETARPTPITISGDPAILNADPELTRAILLNLLLNACYASGEKLVEIVTLARDAYCEVRILDRGPGIPQEVRDHLFEPFITTRPGGTGLGLPIARRLTHLQGGTLTLEDRAGGGTVALLRLPLAGTGHTAPVMDAL